MCPDKGKILTLEEYNKQKLMPEFAAAAQVAYLKKAKTTLKGGGKWGSFMVAAVLKNPQMKGIVATPAASMCSLYISLTLVSSWGPLLPQLWSQVLLLTWVPLLP